MARIDLIDSHDGLGPEQAELYDWIIESRGTLVRPFQVLLHAPRQAEHLARLGHVVRFESGLSGADRELAILATGRAHGCDYVWDTHVGIARREGVSPEALAYSTGRWETCPRGRLRSWTRCGNSASLLPSPSRPSSGSRPNWALAEWSNSASWSVTTRCSATRWQHSMSVPYPAEEDWFGEHASGLTRAVDRLRVDRRLELHSPVGTRNLNRASACSGGAALVAGAYPRPSRVPMPSSLLSMPSRRVSTAASRSAKAFTLSASRSRRLRITTASATTIGPTAPKTW